MPSVWPVVAANAEHDANRELINEVIFLRDLDEVHLLLDFISGRTDKTLNDFEITLPDGTAMQGAKLIEELTKIRYPTPVGRDRAHDAALLLCAKDKLTAMASPARGMTIAFTAMLVGLGTRESGKINDQSRPGVRDILASWFDWVMARLFLKSSTTDTARRHEETDTSGRHSRVALAREAFPWLVPSVRRMQRMLFLVMSFLFVIWLPL